MAPKKQSKKSATAAWPTHVVLGTMYDTSKSGGLSTFMINYAKGLRARGIEVSFVDERSAPWLARIVYYKLLRNALYVLRKDWGMRFYFWAAQRMLRKAILKHARADSLVQVQDPVAMRAIIGRLPEGAKTLLVVQGDLTNMCLSDNVLDRGSKGEASALEIEKDAYAAADALITCDNRLQHHIEQFVPRTPVAIQNFVDEDEFRPLPEKERSALRKQLGLSGFVVFCPRRLVPKNGTVYAAQAMPMLKDLDVTLVFAGDGPDRKGIQEVIDAHGLKSIRLLGDVPHDRIVAYYQAADAVIVPSVNHAGVIEATSISSLEGMGCEHPAIASGIGGLAELIQTGKNGLLTKERDPKSIAGAIRKLAKDPKLTRRLGIEARKTVLRKNSIASQTKRYLAVIGTIRR